MLLALLAAAGTAAVLTVTSSRFRPAGALGLLVVVLIGSALVRELVRYVRRRAQPTVAAVDATHLYLDRPAESGKPLKWPRAQVADVRETRRVGNRGAEMVVEIALADGTTRRFAIGRGEWDRRRIVVALREALGMPG